jgi:hypothetical protein
LDSFAFSDFWLVGASYPNNEHHVLHVIGLWPGKVNIQLVSLFVGLLELMRLSFGLHQLNTIPL